MARHGYHWGLMMDADLDVTVVGADTSAAGRQGAAQACGGAAPEMLEPAVAAPHPGPCACTASPCAAAHQVADSVVLAVVLVTIEARQYVTLALACDLGGSAEASLRARYGDSVAVVFAWVCTSGPLAEQRLQSVWQKLSLSPPDLGEGARQAWGRLLPMASLAEALRVFRLIAIGPTAEPLSVY